MREMPLNEMTMLQLQVFIVAGTELNFTKTAQRLFVTQPTVSRSIDALEKMTGLILFTKHQGRLRLTPAGRSLHKELGEAWDAINSSFARAFEIQEGYNHSLNISVPAGITTAFLDQAKNHFRAQQPLAKLRMHIDSSFDRALQDLLLFNADVIITHLHNRSSIESCTELLSKVIARVPLSAFMKSANPLSQKSTITMKDLRSQRTIFPKQNTEANYLAMVMGEFAKADVVPQISYHVSSSVEGVMNLQEADEVIILNHFAKVGMGEDFVEVPICGTESGLILAIRAADKDKPLIKGFIDGFADCESG